jgi:hypothetical protein
VSDTAANTVGTVAGQKASLATEHQIRAHKLRISAAAANVRKRDGTRLHICRAAQKHIHSPDVALNIALTYA